MAPLGAQGAHLAVQVLAARGYPRIANLAHLFRSRLLLHPRARFIRQFGSGAQVIIFAPERSRKSILGRPVSLTSLLVVTDATTLVADPSDVDLLRHQISGAGL